MTRLMLIFVLLNTLLVLFGIILVFHDFELVASSMALPVNLFAGIVEELTLKDVKYILIALGVALLVVIVIGGIGLVAESRWYLVTYGILMGLLAMANLGGGVYLLNQTDSIKKTVDTFMDDSFLDPSMTIFHEIESRYANVMRLLAVAKIAPSFVLLVQTLQLRQTVENYVNRAFDDPSMNRAVQFLETLLKCCGTSGPEAYINLDGIPPELPPTCCDVQDNGTSCLIEDAYQRGCATLIGEAVQTWSTYLGYLFMVIIAGEVVKLTVASYVIRAIKEKLLRD